MLLAYLFWSFTLLAPQSSDCPDVASCRQAALAAASREDFEAFHDLAWRAVQKGKPNDPELMLLVARAQSLSGRPGDALVMLRRLAQMGVATDAATSDDFRRVRALPAWPDVAALVEAAGKPAVAPAPPPDTKPAVKPEATAEARADSKVAERGSGPATGTGPAPTPPSAIGKSTSPRPPGHESAVSPPDAVPRARTAAPAPASDDEALPPGLAGIQPAGLAHDAVSRRFIVGDRRRNKLVIFDDVFKRATDMAGASAGFTGVSAVEIDHRRGDLWVANSGTEAPASLHKLQLVSGRTLFRIDVPQDGGRAVLVDAAVLPDGGVLLLDADGRRLLRVGSGTREFLMGPAIAAQAPVSLAVLNGNVYVAHAEGILRIDPSTGASARVRRAPSGLLRIRPDRGALVAVQSAGDGQRIVRVRLGADGLLADRTEVLDADAAMPDPAGITVVDGVVCYIVTADGVPVMRRIKARR